MATQEEKLKFIVFHMLKFKVQIISQFLYIKETKKKIPRPIIPSRINWNALSEGFQFSQFKFTLNEIYSLANLFGIPETLRIRSSRYWAGNWRALAFALIRLSYPNRWINLVRIFGRGEGNLHGLINYMYNQIDNRCSTILYLDNEKIMPVNITTCTTTIVTSTVVLWLSNNDVTV